MEAEPTDRRVQRTRRALHAALVDLILERGWDAVSVQDVCDRADIGRSTFYSHFADKENLLIGGLDDLGKALRALGRAHKGSRPFAFVRGMIEHAQEQRRLFQAVIGKRSGHIIQQRFRELLMSLFEEELTAVSPKSPHLQATVYYVTGAFTELLIWWLDTPNKVEPEELAELFQRLTAPVLDELRGATSRERERERRK